MSLKIRSKLILIVIFSIAFAISIKEYMHVGLIIREYEENLFSKAIVELEKINNIISNVASPGFSLDSVNAVEKECQHVLGRIDGAAYCLVMEPQGKIVYHSNLDRVGSLATGVAVQNLLDSQTRLTQKIIDSSGREIYDFSLPIKDSNSKILGFIRLGIKAELINKQIHAHMVDAIKSTLISILLAALLVYFLVQYSILVHLKKLMQGINKFGKGELNSGITVNSKDEIGELAEAFNKMADNLRKTTTSMTALNKEIWQRKAVQEELSLAQTTSVKIMEDLQEAYNRLKETQNQLIQAEKMSALGVLASGVAHEVKNPLGIIIQGANYLEGSLPKDREDIVKVVKMIKEAVARADNIIRGLLDYARVSALVLKPEDVNIILFEALELVKHREEYKKIEFIDQRKDGLPKVLVDKNKMLQVFINLIMNALHAMSHSGGGKLIMRSYEMDLDEIQVKIGRRVIDSFMLGEKVVRVDIEDTGKGIPKENLTKVFDPFFTTRGPREGAGLGLSICANIIELHKGLIEIESETGKGTKVTVTLKITQGK